MLASGDILAKETDSEYVIESYRFLKILLHIEIDTSIEELEEIALLTKTIRGYKFKDEEERDQKIGTIFYFKMLKLLRDALHPHRSKK